MRTIRDDQEKRILETIYSLVATRIQDRLPPGRRGIRAIEPIRLLVPGAVQVMLESIVENLAKEVEKRVEFIREEGGAPLVDARLKVLDNERPCDSCGASRPLAVVELRGGAIVRVECEACAPEFLKGRVT